MLAANNNRKCGQCRMCGHTRRTCPNAAAALNAGQRRALVFDIPAIADAPVPIVIMHVVCKPDLQSDNCMVCLEDKSPDEWVEFGCGHGHCIACRECMHDEMKIGCPYCKQQINELRVTNVRNLVGTRDEKYI